MKLHGSLTSPFMRKCRIMALEHKIDLPLELRSPFDGGPTLANPLLRVPFLETKDGRLFVESGVICDYLADYAGLLPRDLADLNLEALADGLMDRAVARTMRLREEKNFHNPAQLGRWLESISLTLDHLEAHFIPVDDAFGIGEISLVCALGYLDFRHADLAWQDGHEGLAAWYEKQAQRPSVKQTEPPK